MGDRLAFCARGYVHLNRGDAQACVSAAMCERSRISACACTHRTTTYDSGYGLRCLCCHAPAPRSALGGTVDPQ